MNLMRGAVVGEADFGTTWSLRVRLDAPGAPAQGDYDLEVEVPHLVYEILEIERDRHWEFSIHRGSIHVLPDADVGAARARRSRACGCDYGAVDALDVPALDVQRGRGARGRRPERQRQVDAAARGRAPRERRRAGEVRVRIAPWTPGRVAGARRRMASVFQQPLLADMTVAENVALGLASAASARPGAGARGSLARALRHRRPARRARRGRSRAARRSAWRWRARSCSSPSVLLLDEPFAALDGPRAPRSSRNSARSCARTRSRTVLVTHDRAEAQALADRVAVLLGGRIRQLDDTGARLLRAVSEEVARFVGVETIVDGRRVVEGGAP